MTRIQRVAATLLLITLTACSTTRSEEAIDLQFRPRPAEKQTMRVHSKVSSTHPTSFGPDCTEHITTFTVEVEPTTVADDGTVTIRIVILGLFLDAHMNGHNTPLLQYDSSKNHAYSTSDAQYSALIGESFLVTTSAQGKLLELKTDEFFAAVGANRMTYEDEAYRHIPGGRRGEETITRINGQYGSPEKRKRAYAKEAMKSYLIGSDQLRLLASNVLVPLAGEPVKAGAEWKGPVMISIDCPMELAGTYALNDIENGVCTIQVQAQRTPEDKPLSGRYPKGSMLSGTYQATLRVDRATSCLLSRKAVINTAGDLFWPGHSAAGPEGTVPVTIEATTTVEIVKPSPDRTRDGEAACLDIPQPA